MSDNDTFQRFFIISFLADSGAFVLKVLLFVFLNGELAQYGQSVRLLNGRSQVQILYSPISSIEEILYRKKENIIILITKQESIELQKLGYRFGSDGNLHKSKSRHPKYYLTESKKALADLEKIRKSRIVEK